LLCILQDIGLRADIAEDGLQALEQARATRYDLILMDIQMPGMNGIEVTHAIRADSVNRDTPIIAITANAFDEDRESCLAAGMHDHLGKPVDPEQLYEALLRWLAPPGR
jgi:CheY-like chemotaxis protein